MERRVADTGDENIGNYVVDLREQVLLPETGMDYFGTGPSYNRRRFAAYWERKRGFGFSMKQATSSKRPSTRVISKSRERAKQKAATR
jgi:hypothetical protein